MNKNAHTIYIYLAACGLATGGVLPAQAQSEKFIQPAVKAATERAFAPQLERQMANLTYTPKIQAPSFMIQNPRPNLLVKPAKASASLLEDKGVSISDGRGKETGRHSIVPSAVTVLGSPAIARGEERTIMRLRQQAQVASTTEYIPPLERERWKEELEALRVLWTKEEPSDINRLPHYLTHEVPPDTLAYLQREYIKLTQLIQKNYAIVMPKVIYSSLTNEGKQLWLQEKVYINKTIFEVRLKVSVLLKAINTDPSLLVQQKFF